MFEPFGTVDTKMRKGCRGYKINKYATYMTCKYKTKIDYIINVKVSFLVAPVNHQFLLWFPGIYIERNIPFLLPNRGESDFGYIYLDSLLRVHYIVATLYLISNLATSFALALYDKCVF